MQSPGAFPLNPTYEDAFNQTVQEPYMPEAYTPIAQNTDSSIVIVTHRRLSVAESNALYELTKASGPLGNRPITVIWIPTFCHDSHSNSIDIEIANFEYAFNISKSSADRSETDNMLYVLSPCLAKYNFNHPNSIVSSPTDYPFSNIAATQEWKRFQEYLYYLLTNPEENIHVVARNIVWERINANALILLGN